MEQLHASENAAPAIMLMHALCLGLVICIGLWIASFIYSKISKAWSAVLDLVTGALAAMLFYFILLLMLSIGFCGLWILLSGEQEEFFATSLEASARLLRACKEAVAPLSDEL